MLELPDERDTEPDERLLEPDEERVLEPVERLLPEPDETEPEERVEPVEPLPTASPALREPEEVAVLEPALLDEGVIALLIERELTDLDEPPASVRVRPVDASLEPTERVEPLLRPVAWATSLEEALRTAAETPSTLREPLVANEPEARETAAVAPAVPAMAEPPLRP